MTMANTIVVPERFSYGVYEHLCLNFVEFREQPLIMGIFGPPGEGKTFQLRHILDHSGVQVRSINAADLESDRAGQPGRLLLQEYVEASRSVEALQPTVLVIDDIDTTVGEWSQNTGTVNHQQVLAQLMHLADRPNWIERVGAVRRVPIFVTGNDFGKLYPPLRRPGRMVHLLWEPTPEEKLKILENLLKDVAQPRVIEEIWDKYPSKPISFFSQLRMATVRRSAASVIMRSANDFAEIVRNPEKYAKYIAAASNSVQELDVSLRQEAEGLSLVLYASEMSYLDGK
jgi:SpoVK/Ycf46/Vps4 family AAA+-type ATPase